MIQLYPSGQLISLLLSDYVNLLVYLVLII